MKRAAKKRQRLLLILAILLSAVLLATLILGAVISARRRAELEEERKKQEANLPAVTTNRPPSILSNGYESLAAGTGVELKLYYFGDDTFHGRGASAALGVMKAGSCSTLIHDHICATYGMGNRIGGRLIPYVPGSVATTESAISDFADAFLSMLDFRLAILMPTDATLAANAAEKAKPGYRGSLTGDAGKDLEALIRAIRGNAVRCDVLLAIPPSASDTLADALLSLAAYYELQLVDLRPLASGQDGLMHTEGQNIGYPNEAGHRAIADAITAAIEEAAARGHSSPKIPSTKLY